MENGFEHLQTREDFVDDVMAGMNLAPMSVRLTPHILSVIDWANPIKDPVRRQFLPLKSTIMPDHPMLSLDSLHEQRDSPVPGLVHRYPDKALFLATSVCPVYCRFCTRSYSVGGTTELISSKKSFAPARRRWAKVFEYIRNTPQLIDIVVSGGDSYYLNPEHITEIGHQLLSIPHIRRLRFASKGMAVSPSRMLTDHSWTSALIEVVNTGRKMGKHVALHTHFNHPNEITWVTKMAAQVLFENAVTVRNQTVLLKGINDDVETMKTLIKQLGNMNIQPYYVYQGDMVRGVEDLRTPLSTILNLEHNIRGTTSGFYTPNFVIDLPGGGGKRIASTYMSYDRVNGVSRYVAPGVKGETVHEYYDPLWSLSEEARKSWASRGQPRS
ncbi:uncharacterized protein VTP21DRAFT_3521 [Calcarisporiella thermophila]|uniref:uncharacterized protein n=1 Tax=Calcarisporiella thermophila TaxID=911321 RepID=UPI0037436F99